MRKLMILCFTAALVVPALATAGSRPSAADRAAAVRQCSTERGAMGVDAFKLLYGTNLPTRSNAFGKCVSRLAQQNEQGRANAAAQCRSERSADPTAFATKYGSFGKSVPAQAKAAAAARVHATINAAKDCWTERQADPAAFKDKYGTNANKSNAFGKCVSGKVKHTP